MSGAVTGRRGPRGDRAWRTPADLAPRASGLPQPSGGGGAGWRGLRSWVLPPRVSWALRCPQVRARNRTGISWWCLPVLLSVLLSGLCAQSTPRGLASVCRAPCPAAEGGGRSAALVSAEKSSRSRRLLLNACLRRGPPSCRPRALFPDPTLPTGCPPPTLRPAAAGSRLTPAAAQGPAPSMSPSDFPGRDGVPVSRAPPPLHLSALSGDAMTN